MIFVHLAGNARERASIVGSGLKMTFDLPSAPKIKNRTAYGATQLCYFIFTLQTVIEKKDDYREALKLLSRDDVGKP